MDFLVGYFGACNVGDDAILHAYLERNSEEVKILWNVETPSSRYVFKKSFLSVLFAIASSKRVIFPGGGIIQDKTSFFSFLYYMGIILAAKLYNKKVVMLSQSLGPLNRGVSRNIARLLNFVDVLALRDGMSLSVARGLDLKESILHEVRDIVFTIKFAPCEKKKIVGINLRKTNEAKRSIEAIVKFSSTLRQNGYKIRGVSFCQEDRDFLERCGISFDEIISGDVFSTFSAVSECELFVTTRFHGAVFCIKSKTPFVCVDYDPKVGGFMKSIGLEDCCHKFITLDHLTYLYEKKGALQDRIASALPDIESLAEKNFFLLGKR